MLCCRKRLIGSSKGIKPMTGFHISSYLLPLLMLCLVLQHQSPLTHTAWTRPFSPRAKGMFYVPYFRLIKFSYEQVAYENFLILKFYVRIILCTEITRFTVSSSGTCLSPIGKYCTILFDYL